MSEYTPNEFNEPEDKEIPLSARFQARRAILNAQTQAKISDGSIGRGNGCCKEIRPSCDINDFIEDIGANQKIVCKILPNGIPRRAFNEYDENKE